MTLVHITRRHIGNRWQKNRARLFDDAINRQMAVPGSRRRRSQTRAGQGTDQVVIMRAFALALESLSVLFAVVHVSLSLAVLLVFVCVLSCRLLDRWILFPRLTSTREFIASAAFVLIGFVTCRIGSGVINHCHGELDLETLVSSCC